MLQRFEEHFLNFCAGNHNFFEVEYYEDHDCTEVQPHCLLFNERDELAGFCFAFPSLMSSPRFEHSTVEGINVKKGKVLHLNFHENFVQMKVFNALNIITDHIRRCPAVHFGPNGNCRHFNYPLLLYK